MRQQISRAPPARVAEQHRAPTNAPSSAAPGPPFKEGAWPATKQPTEATEAIELLVKAGMLQRDDIDDETRAKLFALPVQEQLFVLRRFHNAIMEHKIASNR